MNSSSLSTAIIPYTPPVSTMEFIRAEVKKEISQVTIQPQQTNSNLEIQQLMSSDLANLSLNDLCKMLEDVKDPNLLGTRRVEKLPLRDGDHFPESTSMRMRTFTAREHGLLDDFEYSFFEDFGIESTSRISSVAKVNGKEIAEILQSEAGFTISTDEKPILATYGCGPCVAMGGYDATNSIAFMVHFSGHGEVRKSTGLLSYNISKLVDKKIESPIQLHLRGGIKGRSEETIEAIKTWMKQRKDLPMEIASEDILGSGSYSSGKSLSIDSRDGSVSDYHPLTNPERRELSVDYAMITVMRGLKENIKVVYTPKV